MKSSSVSTSGVVLQNHRLADRHFCEHLRCNSAATLQAAYMTDPRFCNKFFHLEKLVEIARDEYYSLKVSNDHDLIRFEAARRFFIHADRRRLREPFLQCLAMEAFADSDLERFVGEYYVARQPEAFARSEGRYLQGLVELSQTGSPFRRPASDALAWFGVGRKRQVFRILFSNRRYHLGFPGVLMPGLCIAFSIRQECADSPFSIANQMRLSQEFVEAACRAESEAYSICDQEFVGRSYRSLEIEDASLDPTVMDGRSGYLAFLMAHLFRIRGATNSPYLGFTGSVRELGQLDVVDDLSEKIQAAIAAGMLHLFVPKQCFQQLNYQDQYGHGLLKVHPFDEGDIHAVAKRLFAFCNEGVNVRVSMATKTVPIVGPARPEKASTTHRNAQDDVAMKVEESRPLSGSQRNSSTASNPSQRTPTSDGPSNRQATGHARNAVTVTGHNGNVNAGGVGELLGAQKLFREQNLQYFQEIGGSRRLTGASFSALNAENGEFLTLYPQHNRLRLYEAFGAERSRWEVNKPSAICWDHLNSLYIVGFEDRIIRWYGSTPELPGGAAGTQRTVPRKMVSFGTGELFVSDGDRMIAQIDPAGNLYEVDMQARVCDLCRNPIEEDLLIVMPGSVQVLGTSGPKGRFVKCSFSYEGDSAVAAVGPKGDVWLSTSRGERCGELIRFSRVGHSNVYQQTVTKSCVSSPAAILVLEKLVVVGGRDGSLLVFDHQGRRIGSDSLGVDLSHLAAGPGNLIVVSTQKGPSVIIPHQLAVSATDDHKLSEMALQRVSELEGACRKAGVSSTAVGAFLDSVKLHAWPETLALQRVILERRKAQPQLYANIVRALAWHDARKADCLTSETIPAFIDGSNVSRHHYRNGRGAARLESIFAMQRTVESWTSPVRYPIITVVDSTERHQTDDHPQLTRLLDEGFILEAPTKREADALIFSMIAKYEWYKCEIVSNDAKMYKAHAEMLPDVDEDWYVNVRQAFTINTATNQVQVVKQTVKRPARRKKSAGKPDGTGGPRKKGKSPTGSQRGHAAKKKSQPTKKSKPHPYRGKDGGRKKK